MVVSYGFHFGCNCCQARVCANELLGEKMSNMVSQASPACYLKIGSFSRLILSGASLWQRQPMIFHQEPMTSDQTRPLATGPPCGTKSAVAEFSDEFSQSEKLLSVLAGRYNECVLGDRQTAAVGMRTLALSLLLLWAAVVAPSPGGAANVQLACSSFCNSLEPRVRDTLGNCEAYCEELIATRLQKLAEEMEEVSEEEQGEEDEQNVVYESDKRFGDLMEAPERRVSSFVRIGKARPSSFVRIGRARPSSFVRIGRPKPSSFVRIGKARPSSFVRIGKKSDEGDEHLDEPAGEKRTSSFVRIGRKPSSFVRIGKASSFVRIGKSDQAGEKRGRPSSFVRIGKSHDDDGFLGNEDKRASSFVRIGKSSQTAEDPLQEEEQKRTSSFVRIGKSATYPHFKRLSSFVRIGKKSDEDASSDNQKRRASSFVRIGKAMPSEEAGAGDSLENLAELVEASNTDDKRASSFVRIGRSAGDEAEP